MWWLIHVLSWENYHSKQLYEVLTAGVPNRFGGMLDLAFFRRALWYLGFELKTRARSGNYNYEWERDFVFLWGWDVGFARGTERDTGFQFLRDFRNCYWPVQKPQAGRNEPYSCVRFQVMNSNRSVPCQILSNVSSISDILMLASAFAGYL